MALRVGSAVRRRLNAMQRQLEVARQAAGMERQVLAGSLGVTPRTLRDWERCYETPSMPNLIGWAHAFGFRLTLVDRQGAVMLPPVPLPSGLSLVEHEVGRFAVALKARREAGNGTRAPASRRRQGRQG